MKQSVCKSFLIAICALLMLAVMAVAAACAPKTHTLTFVSGDGTEIASITANAGDGITPPADPVREGYSFDGWFLADDFSGEAVELPAVMPDEDITYYAKFSELPTAVLSLDAGEGGTLATSQFEVTVGTNISEFLEDIVPSVVGDVVFGGWFNGNVALSESQTMPATGLTLTAKYQVGYSVEIYLQNVEGDGYTQDETASFEETGWLGDTVTGSSIDFDTPAHFRLNATRSQSVELGTGENVLRVYFDRYTYSIYYRAAAPSGTESSGEMEDERDIRNGASVPVKQSGFEVEGYRFAGWATADGGEVVYQPGDAITLNGRSVTLYACWDYGIEDSENGSDIIYILSAEEDVVILERMGMDEQRGTYDPDQRIFVFKTSSGKELRGKISADGKTFSYFNEALADVYQKYDWTTGAVSDQVTLQLDGFDGAVYTEGGKATSGTYQKSGRNYLFASENEETSFTFRLDVLNGQEVFLISDGTAGTFYQMDSSGQIYQLPILILDGFGGGSCLESLTSIKGISYRTEAGVIVGVATDSEGNEEPFYCKTDTVETTTGATMSVFVLSDIARGTYSIETQGGKVKLECDGFNGAVYTDANGVAHETVYMVSSGYAEGDTMWNYILFLSSLSEAEEESPEVLAIRFDSAGVQDPAFADNYSAISETRAGSGVTVRLRLQSETEATLEVLMMDGTYRQAVKGTYEQYGDEQGYYKFTATEYEAYEYVNFEEILKPYYNAFVYGLFTTEQGGIVFMIGDESAGIYEFTVNGTPVKLDCSGFGFAELTVNESSQQVNYTYYEGYADEDGVWGFVAFANGDVVYLIKIAVNGDPDIPSSAVLLETEGALIGNMADLNDRIAGYEEFLQFFPDGKAIVHVKVDGDYILIEGHYLAVEGMDGFYDFTAEKYPEGAPGELKEYYDSFRFTYGTLGETQTVFCLYRADEVLELTQDGITLSLSGYGLATYDETQYYYQMDGDTVTLINGNGSSSILIKLNADHTGFTVSGAERGIYFAYTDGTVSVEDYLIELDGYDKAVLYRYIAADEEAGTEATTEKVAEGTYSKDGLDFTVSFAGIEGYESLQFTIGVVTIGQTGIPVYSVADPSLVKNYQIEGGGSITIDKYNQTVFTDANGEKVTVTTRQMADEYIQGRTLLLVYTSGSLTAVYAIDGEKLTLLGTEYGKYNELVGGSIYGEALVLDGCGKAQLLDGDGAVLMVGTYTKGAVDGAWVFHSEEEGFTFYLAEVMSGSTGYTVYSRYDEAWETSFVSDDWEVMILSGHGTVTFVNEKGEVSETFYVVYSDTVIGIYDATTGEYTYYEVNTEDGSFVLTDVPAESQAA